AHCATLRDPTRSALSRGRDKVLEREPTQENDLRRRPSAETPGSLHRQSVAAAGTHGKPPAIHRDAAERGSEVALHQQFARAHPAYPESCRLRVARTAG